MGISRGKLFVVPLSWDDNTRYSHLVDRAVRVSPEDARKAGISHDHVKINQRYGGGFPVNVEGLHHLHCLNLLRKALYYNYDYYRDLGEGAFKNDEYIVKRHVCKYPPRFSVPSRE